MLLVIVATFILKSKTTQGEVAVAETTKVATIPKEPCPKTLTDKEWVLCRIGEAGFSTITANKVITCESGWNNQATHLNKNKTTDAGIWQINDIHGLSLEDRFDVYKSTEYAIKLLKSSNSWSHWVCYNKTK